MGKRWQPCAEFTDNQAEAAPEQKLWQAVIYNAVLEATHPDPVQESLMWKKEADRWLRRGSDLHVVCALAGIDPDFVRGAYIDGRINRDLLKASQQ